MRIFILSVALLCGLSATASAQLMSPENAAAWRSRFPLVEDLTIQRAMESPDTILYTDREMPAVFQHAGEIFPTTAHINALPDPHGNGNREFPWLRPAGTDRVRNLATVRFISLPKQPNGRPYPIAFWFGPIPSPISNDSGRVAQWVFPKGTIVGEVLFQGYQGKLYPFEVRVRIKESDQWATDSYRPFPNKQALVARLNELGAEQVAQQVSGTHQYLAKPLVDRQSRRGVFREPQGAVEALPPLDPNLTISLLTETTFKSSAGQEWEPNARAVCYAPTSTEDFSIVPGGYSGGVVRVDSRSCARCHETTLHHVNEFAPNGGFNPARGTREWYGRIRGSDGIFSFHIFALNQLGGVGAPPRMRQALVQAGLLAQVGRDTDRSIYFKLPEYDPVLYRGPRNQGMVVGGRVVGLSHKPETQLLDTRITARKQQQKPTQVLLFFTADWCHYCQQMKPEVEAFQRAGYKINTINVDTPYGRRLARDLQVNRYPTTMMAVQKDDILIPTSRRTGYLSRNQLYRFVRENTPSSALPGPE